MAEFYKMNPSAWDFGTSNLSLEEEAAYLRIINAINKHDAPVPDNDRVLAGMFRCSTRKARALLNALVNLGKVRIEDGQIINDRAISEVFHRRFTRISRVEAGAKGGRTRAENAAKALKENDTGQASASTREEKRREEKSITLEGKPSNAQNASQDPAKLVFDSGLALLAKAGISEARARPILGKWRKLYGDSSVIEALGRAQREGAIDPVAFVEGALRHVTRNTGTQVIDGRTYVDGRDVLKDPRSGDRAVIRGTQRVYVPHTGWVEEH